MARPMWFVDLLKKNFGMRYLGAEMTKWPVIGQVMERALFDGHCKRDALLFLPKDRVVTQADIDEGGPFGCCGAVHSGGKTHLPDGRL